MTEQIDFDAALAEGLAPMPDHLIPLRDEYLSLKDEKDSLAERQDEIKAAFDAALKDDGLQGFILYGKVHARRSDVTNTRVNAKLLKEKMPHIYSKFLTVTKSVRINIT
jgi:predicted phage-related endonuclease